MHECRDIFGAMIEKLPKIFELIIPDTLIDDEASLLPPGFNLKLALDDLHKIFDCFTDEQSNRLLQLIEEKIPLIINSAKSLVDLLSKLGPNSCRFIIDRLAKDDSCEVFFLSFEEISMLSNKLSSENFLSFLRLKRIQLVMGSVPYLCDFLFLQLSKEACDMFIHEFKTYVISHMHTTEQLKSLLRRLNLEQRCFLLPNIFDSIVIDALTPAIEIIYDLKEIGEYFTFEHCASNQYYKLFYKIFDIYINRISLNDIKLIEYITFAITKIKHLELPGVFDKLDLEFSEVLSSVNSYEVMAVKIYIMELKAIPVMFGSSHKKNSWTKAQDIENALVAMSPETRGTVLSQDTNPVKTAISISLITGKVSGAPLAKVQRILEDLRSRAASRDMALS